MKKNEGEKTRRHRKEKGREEAIKDKEEEAREEDKNY